MKESFVQGLLLSGVRTGKTNSIFYLAKKIVALVFVFVLSFSGIVKGQTVTVTSNKNPSCVGESVTFTATVSPIAAGFVTFFYDGTNQIGLPVPILLGTASISTSTLPAGSRAITAGYGLLALVITSTSQPITQVVNTPTVPTFVQVGPLCLNSAPVDLPPASTNGVTGTWTPATVTTASAGRQTYTFNPDPSLCASRVTMDVEILAPPAVPTTTLTQPTCALATGTIVVNTPAPAAGITYSIDGTNYVATNTFNNLAPGPYTVTARNGPCTSPPATVTINAQPPTPAAPTTTPTQPTCAVATGSIVITAPTGAGLTYSIDGTNYVATTTFNNLTPGPYNVTVRNGPCTSTVTPVTINAQPPTPAAPSITPTQPTCAVATGSIAITAPTGAGLTYSIDGTNYVATTTFNNLAPGPYNVTVRNGPCTSTATPVTINAQPPTPAAPTITPTQPTCAVPTGSIVITAPTGAGLTYSIDGTNYVATTTFNNLAPGPYSVTVRNATCTSPVSAITINPVPAPPAAPSTTLTQPTCAVTTGSIVITAPTGAGLTYSIDGTNYVATTTFNNLAPGPYNVTVRTGTCTSTISAVTINPVPTPPAAPTTTLNQPTCAVATGSIVITAPTGAGLTYSIDGTNYVATTTFNNLAPGPYNVTARNGTCTSTISAVTINAQPPTPAAPTTTLTQPTCAVATGSIVITAPTGAGLTYSIDGTNYVATTTFNNLAPGPYNVTVRNGGCTSTISAVTINAVPTPPAAPTTTLTQPTCAVATGSIVITAPTGAGLTYSIDGTNYVATTTFNNLAPGPYNVTARTGTCTSAISAVTINAVPTPPAAPTTTLTQPTCAVATGSIVITAPTGAGFTYSIDGTNYVATTTFNNLAPGPYNVTARTGTCTSTISAVTINAVPTPPAAPTTTLTQPTCAVATGSIVITAPTGAGLTYSIDGTNYVATTTFNNLAPGPYNVTARTGTCTSTISAVTINAVPAPPAAPTTTLTQPTCAVTTGSIVITAPTGAGLTYSIDGTNYVATTTFNNLAPGPYNVTARTGTCTSTISAVTINAVPTPPAAPTTTLTQPTCAVATGSIVITAPTGAGLTYSIDGTNYVATTTFNNLAPGPYNVTARNGGCTSTISAVTINAVPTPPAAPTTTLTQPTCAVATGSIVITAPTGAGLTYSIDGTNYVATTTFNNLAPGPYNVTARTGTCTSTISAVTINAVPAPPAAPTTTLTQPTCAVTTGSIVVTAPTGAGLTYSIDGTNYVATTTFNNLAPGPYNVTARNGGCTSTISAVTINAVPTPPAAPTTTLTQPTCAVATGSIVITAPTGAGLTYSIDGTNYVATTTFNNLAPGPYNVTARNGGCTSTISAVTINAVPTPPAAPTTTLTQPTCAVATGSIVITAPTGAGLTYSIDGTNYVATTTFNNLAPGPYNVTARNGGCTSTISAVTIN